jgi:hypothetical protein
MNLKPEEARKYFEQWIAYSRICNDDGEASPSFEEYVMELKALEASMFPRHEDEPEDSSPLGVTPESQDKLQELLSQCGECDAVGGEIPFMSPVTDSTSNEKEKLTLRDNVGRLIGHYEMTRHEFLKTMNGLFDHVRQSDKYPNTYNAW